MILNNYLTMQRIRELRDEPLSRDLVFEIHGMITEDTLHDARGAGRFRRPDEPIHVVDYRGADEIELHMPPPAEELEGRMEAMCGFANEKISSTDPVRASRQFVHPVIRSIILHFWLAYDHPFVDGNGRTARALFYWSMLRHGFWLFEFISITRILLKAKSKYTRAFLYTETDENDLTYFILHQLEVIDRAIKELHAYLDRKKKEMEAIERELRHAGLLNERQRALLTRALKEPATRFTFRSHQVSHNVVYQTARNDLLGLKKHGLLEKCKIGRTWYFTPVEDLPEKLSAL
jgi:Fic family protein